MVGCFLTVVVNEKSFDDHAEKNSCLWILMFTPHADDFSEPENKLRNEPLKPLPFLDWSSTGVILVFCGVSALP